jgi:hypothetical protein
MPPPTQPSPNMHGTMPLPEGMVKKAANAVKDAVTGD